MNVLLIDKVASERDIRRADKVLRNYRARIGTEKSRLHREGMWKNMQRQRALDGLCGDCKNLDIKLHGHGRGRGVQLYCRRKHNPVSLYANTPLGKKVECIDFAEK